MPLSSKIRADYVEMINSKLDSIKVEQIQDVEVVQQSLQKILKSVANSVAEEKYQIPEKYNDSMESIRECLAEPEIWVANIADYAEYQEIIRERILRKIDEFTSMTYVQKENYIANQKQHEQKSENTTILAQQRAPQPWNAAYLPDMTEQEELQRRQNEFNEEGWILNLHPLWRSNAHLNIIRHIWQQISALGLRPSERILARLTMPDCLDAIRDGVFSVMQLADFSEEGMWLVMQPHSIQAMRANVFSIEELKPAFPEPLLQAIQAEPNVFTLARLHQMHYENLAVILSPQGIQALRDNTFTLEQLQRFNNRYLLELAQLIPIYHYSPQGLQYFPSIIALTLGNIWCRRAIAGGDFTLEHLERFDAQSLAYVLQPHCIKTIVEELFTLGELEALHGKSLQAVTSSICINAIHQNIFTMEQLLRFHNEYVEEISRGIPEAVATRDEVARNYDIPGLTSIITNHCISALKDNVFTLEQLRRFPSQSLAKITEPLCIAAIRDQIYTLADLERFGVRELDFIIDPQTIQAVQEGRTSLSRLSEMEIGDLIRAVDIDEYPPVLEVSFHTN